MVKKQLPFIYVHNATFCCAGMSATASERSFDPRNFLDEHLVTVSCSNPRVTVAERFCRENSFNLSRFGANILRSTILLNFSLFPPS